MFRHPWTRREIALLAAIVTLAALAAVRSIGLAYPEPIPQAALGPEWQCSRFAFVITTCTRIRRAVAAPARLRKASACPRPRTAQGSHQPIAAAS